MYVYLLYCIVLYCIVLYCIVLYCIVLYCIVLYCIVLYCIVLYCIVLYCIVLYCIVLYCIVLYCIVSGWSSHGTHVLLIIPSIIVIIFCMIVKLISKDYLLLIQCYYRRKPKLTLFILDSSISFKLFFQEVQ